MELEYLIDGYNFLLRRRVKRLMRGPGNLERARSALLAWIATRLPPRTKATVVFDSSLATGASHTPHRRDESGIRVYYAGGYPSADALIGEFCLHCPTPESLIVVSDDNEVTSWAEKCKVRAIGCSEFDDILHGARGSTGVRRERPPQSPPEADKPGSITAEELAYWQNEFDGAHPIDDPEDAPLRIERRLPPPPPADLTWPEPKKAKAKKPRVADSEERFRRELDDLTEFYQAMLADEAERKEKDA